MDFPSSYLDFTQCILLCFLHLEKAPPDSFLGLADKVFALFPSFWGINGILYAQPIADVISAIVTVFMALHLHKELATTKEH